MHASIEEQGVPDSSQSLNTRYAFNIKVELCQKICVQCISRVITILWNCLFKCN